MPTNKPRVNVSFEDSTVDILSQIAKSRDQSIASLVRELVLEALDMHEDYHLSKLADERDRKGVKTFTHEEVWKEHTKSSIKKQ